MKALSNLEAQNKPLAIFVGFALIGMIGILDYVTGYEYAFSLFYVLPISLITWISNRRTGYIASIASAVVWLWADASAGNPYPRPLIPLWNSLIRLAFFIIITFLLSALKDALRRERELSYTDYLTTASSSRYFYEIVQMEINRLERKQRPFTIAYMDLDDFKIVNDKFGHAEGDLLLQKVVSALKRRIRHSDMVARLGGDEFALFFPETDQTAARLMFPEIHNTLLEEMQRNNWSVTFSIGVTTCMVAPRSINELIKAVDNLMYSAKSEGKNRVKYSLFTGQPDQPVMIQD